jgi:hypothetical protein
MILRIAISVVLYLQVTHVTAQLRIEQVPLSPIKSRTGFFVYGAGNLNSEVPYSKINGSPFWNSQFINATIYLTETKPYVSCPVKLNIATNEVHFLSKSGDELTAQTGMVEKIVFYKRDNSAEISTVFRNDFEVINSYPKFKDLYVQELNQGNIQLLKVSRKTLKVGDSLFGTQKKYSFHLEESYFLKHNNRIQALKKINKKEILQYMPLYKNLEDWINSNRIDFAIEKDVIRFIDYINQRPTTVRIQ